MSGEGWLTIGVTAAVFVALIFNLPGDLLFVGAAVVLAVIGYSSPSSSAPPAPPEPSAPLSPASVSAGSSSSCLYSTS